MSCIMYWTFLCLFFNEGHAYNAHDRCLAAGYDNGDIKLFDLRAMSLRWETNIKNGVRLSLNLFWFHRYLLEFQRFSNFCIFY